MFLLRNIQIFIVCAIILIIGPTNTQASIINFSGQLDYILVDEGGGIYSGVAIGTDFKGSIDDNNADGYISDGETYTSFSCCIAGVPDGGLSVLNNVVLSAEDETFLNGILGFQQYSAGDIVDLIKIMGRKSTNNGGRIGIGIDYILPADAFDSNDLSNYPVNQTDVELALFFIEEVNGNDEDIHFVGGKIIDSSLSDGDNTACSDIAGEWEGNWSETSCDTLDYSGPWTGSVSNDCIFTGTDNWDFVSGTIDHTTMILAATGTSKDGCGSVNLTGTFTSNSVSGSYTYSVSGGGTFSGSKNAGNVPVDGGGGGGGGGCFLGTMLNF